MRTMFKNNQITTKGRSEFQIFSNNPIVEGCFGNITSQNMIVGQDVAHAGNGFDM